MSNEEKRQSVVFAALFRYQAQRFELLTGRGAPTRWSGDVMSSLPTGVEPVMLERDRWLIWRNALPPSATDRDVDTYQYKHWCGGLALCSLHEADLALDVFWRDGVGFCEPEKLTRVKIPEPGDIAYFSRNSHYAIVESVHQNETGVYIDTIDGNQGKSLARPSIKRYQGRMLSAAAAYYSIGKFL